MNKHKNDLLLKISRITVQILFFIFLPALYFQTLTGVKQLYLAVIHRQFTSAIWPQLAEMLVIVPITIIVGRFFCGWMCAFGSFTDLIYRISQKLFHNKIRINEKTDHWMKYLKYVVLLLIIVTSWTLSASVFSSSNPWDAFGMLVTIGKAPDFTYVFSNLTIGFILFILIIVASTFTERFFCRYLCPMGAIFSLISKLKIVKIAKPSANCGNCRACTNACAMGIHLYKMDSVASGECIGCMKCVSVCPRKDVSVTVSKHVVRPLATGVTAAAIVAGMYYTANFTLNQVKANTSVTASQTETQIKNQSSSIAQPSKNAEGTNSSVSSGQLTGQYKDGTYHGSGSGFRGGTTKVTVIVSGGKITAINVDSNEDTPNFFNAAYEAISNEIISSQSPEVDAISGATYSSKGIMKAVSNALESAKI